MKKDFMKYFESLGMQQRYIERTEKLYRVAKEISPAPIEDVFVSEYLDDGVRRYENVWFFTSGSYHAIEAHDFIRNDHVDIAPITGRVKNLIIRKRDYDFESATEKSRLSIEFATDFGGHGAMKACKKNCDHLKYITLTYLKPNFLP